MHVLDYSKNLLGKPVINRSYGLGSVSNFYLDEECRLFIEVVFSSKEAKFDFKLAYQSRFLEFNDYKDDSFAKDLIYLLNSLQREHAEKMKDRAKIEVQERKDNYNRMKQEKKLKKQEEDFEAAKKRAIERFENMTCVDYASKGYSEQFYYSLGWLVANVGTISARLPDYLDSCFSAHFGSDSPRTKVNSRRRTVNGFKPQWTYSFTASFRKGAIVPAMLQKSLNSAQTKIADTSFIWTIVDKHNFKFGKTQDIDAIRETVPNNMLQWFEAGLNS